ncbi:hypothetical protein C8R44DRAFT_753185 [Mycena epipterygia]|nr:hypothetical protein C8R44DRAFT_753185 [Mycena epipterygia]
MTHRRLPSRSASPPLSASPTPTHAYATPLRCGRVPSPANRAQDSLEERHVTACYAIAFLNARSYAPPRQRAGCATSALASTFSGMEKHLWCSNVYDASGFWQASILTPSQSFGARATLAMPEAVRGLRRPPWRSAAARCISAVHDLPPPVVRCAATNSAAGYPGRAGAFLDATRSRSSSHSTRISLGVLSAIQGEGIENVELETRWPGVIGR